jgi:colanic acid/amylovoran biosynthesis glycosyltransferase
MKNSKTAVICIVHPYSPDGTETFIQAQIDRLSGRVIEVCIDAPTIVNELRISGVSFLHQAFRKFRKEIGFVPDDTNFFVRFLKKKSIDLVLAQYGPSAVFCLDACLLARVPLIPYFHGFDASIKTILERYHTAYNRLFKECPAIIAVSKTMIEKLVSMGAPREKIYHISCGVDTAMFSPVAPEKNPPNFVSVGRFVEKKAPFLTIIAFEQAFRECPSAKLTMAGGGVLLDSCKALVKALGLDEVVKLPGKITHNEVVSLMGQARAFLQHSICAPNGNSEGTPVSIMEAGARGLPVVATRHAGIPEVVSDGETGLLVNEYDLKGMAEHIITLAKDAEYAGKLGRNANKRIKLEFDWKFKIEQLESVLNLAAQSKSCF